MQTPFSVARATIEGGGAEGEQPRCGAPLCAEKTAASSSQEIDAATPAMAPTDARAIVDAVASAFQSGSTDFATAKRQLATAIRLAPTLADAHYYRGGLDVLRGDGQSALPHLRWLRGPQRQRGAASGEAA